jgi:hypothetical protein
MVLRARLQLLPYSRYMNCTRPFVTTLPNCLPTEPNVTLTVTRRPGEVDDWITSHALLSGHNESQAVGFDIEWRPNFRVGEKQPRVVVVQLAVPTAALVVQVRLMRQLPASLQALLAFPKCIKVGVDV